MSSISSHLSTAPAEWECETPLLPPNFAAQGLWPSNELIDDADEDARVVPQVLERCDLWPHTKIASSLLAKSAASSKKGV